MNALKNSAFRALESMGQSLLESGKLPDSTQAEFHEAFLSFSISHFFRPLHDFLTQKIGLLPQKGQDRSRPALPRTAGVTRGPDEAFFEACEAWLKSGEETRAALPCHQEVARLPGALYEQLLGQTARVAEHDLVLKERRSGSRVYDAVIAAQDGKTTSKKAGKRAERFIGKGTFFLTREKGWNARKGSGTFYTPAYIVRHMVEKALGSKLRHNRSVKHPATSLSSREILSLSVLDPAMGSGAFLLAATQYLAEALQHALAGEEHTDPSNLSLPACRQAVIRSCIYGVDLDPHAAEMARLSLMLFAWDGEGTVTEPELHLKTGDSLFGVRAGDVPGPLTLSEADALARRFYMGKAGAKVHTATGRADADHPVETGPLPLFFHWDLEYPERFMARSGHEGVMRNSVGFSVIVSNPPYGDLLAPQAKAALKRFGYPPVGGRAEVAAHFFHLGLRLLESGGALSYIVPNTMIDGRQFNGLRRDLTTRARVASIVDYAGDRVFPDADVYAMIVQLEADSYREAQYDALYVRPEAGTVKAAEERIRIHARSAAPWRKVVPFVDRLETADAVEPLSPGLALCRDAGLDYKYKRVGWSRRGRKKRLSGLLTYEGQRKDARDLPLIRGRDIGPFRIAETHHYLKHDWEKHRNAHTAVLIYRELAEVPVKIVTRQTSDRLVAALDRQGRYTAKSVHTILVTNPDCTPEFICALLNSRVMNFIYQAYTGERGRAFAQVKVSDLRLLPVCRTGSASLGQAQPIWREHRDTLLRHMARQEYDRILGYVERLLPLAVQRATFTPAQTGVAHQLVTELVRHAEGRPSEEAANESLKAVLDAVFDRLYGVSTG